MRGILVAAAVAPLALQAPAVGANQVIGSLSSPHGVPNQGVPVLVHQHVGRFRRGIGTGFCCFLSGAASAPVIVVSTPAAPGPPAPAPAAQPYAPPTVETAAQGVTIVRGPPIPP